MEKGHTFTLMAKSTKEPGYETRRMVLDNTSTKTEMSTWEAGRMTGDTGSDR